jgi:ELWxxDGT repeat protein
MKTIIALIAMALLLVGCGGGNSGNTNNQSSTSGSSSTKYMAFSPEVYNNDEIWQTDGTLAGTRLVDNSMKISNSTQDKTLTITALFNVGNKLVSSVRYVDDSAGGILPSGYEKLYKTDPTTQNSGVVIPSSTVGLGLLGIATRYFKNSSGDTFIIKEQKLYKLDSNSFTLTQISPNDIILQDYNIPLCQDQIQILFYSTT